MSLNRLFTRFANAVSKWTGRPVAFTLCVIGVLAWAVSGPAFGFSETWQLVINTSTTIVTFLMVFLIQNTQNRDNAALHAKLDELIRVGASDNRFIGIEHLTDQELEVILEECEKAAKELHVELRNKRSHHKDAGAAKAVEVPAIVKKAVAKRSAARKPAAKRKPA
ncbi:MAG TPA: low affinity iron permease family protein [Caulobacter sp.]|nr:low affinity iron permease family protein [Caulobacter sp.]